MPGVKKEDMHMNVEGDMLTLSAEKHGERKEEDATCRMTERFSGSISNRMRIPMNANKSMIHAELINGVLHITMPKIVPDKEAAVVKKLTIMVKKIKGVVTTRSNEVTSRAMWSKKLR